MGKTIRRTAAALTALAAVMSQSTVFASALKKGTKADLNWFGDYMYIDRQSEYNAANKTEEEGEGSGEGGGGVVHSSPYHETLYNPDTSSLPSKFDQRDVAGVNRVPEIRFQNPFGLCWAFAANAAVEIAYAFTRNIDYNTATDEQKAAGDFSERALAYFSLTSLAGNNSKTMSQAGEGFVNADYYDLLEAGETGTAELNDALFSYGGIEDLVITALTSLTAPVLESEAPYINDEHTYEVTIRVYNYEDDPESTKGYKRVEDEKAPETLFYENKSVTYEEYIEQVEKVTQE